MQNDFIGAGLFQLAVLSRSSYSLPCLTLELEPLIIKVVNESSLVFFSCIFGLKRISFAFKSR